MEIVNCTPHVLNIVKKNGEIKDLAPSGVCPRVKSESFEFGEIGGISLTLTKYGEIEGLPEYSNAHLYVVSRLVFQAAEGRADLVCPGELVRDSAGKVIGCKGLSR